MKTIYFKCCLKSHFLEYFPAVFFIFVHVLSVGLIAWLLCVVSDVLVKMPYVDGELPVYWWDSEADRCMIIGIFRHGTSCVCVSVLVFVVSVVLDSGKDTSSGRQ